MGDGPGGALDLQAGRDAVEPGSTARREWRTRGRVQARLTLLRHGEPDWAAGRDGATVNDPGLTAYGQAQAKVVARAIADEGVDAIYVSPYLRSQQTAVPLAEATGIEPVTVEGLREIGVRFEGLTQEEVDKVFVEGARRPLYEHWEGWPGGEAFGAFHARVVGALTEILGQHDMQPRPEGDFTVWRKPESANPHVVIVAHGGTNAVLLTHLLDIRPVPWEWLRFESALCAYSVVQARPLGETGYVWSLQNFNEVDPQRNAGLLR